MIKRTTPAVTHRCLTLLCLILLAGVPTQAQDSTGAVSVTGFVDTYGSWNFARPSTHVSAYRNFDVTENQFVLSQAEVSISRSAAPVGFHIDADYGTASDMIESGVSGSTATVQQAYATVVIPAGSGLTVDAGKFVTHMGYEVIKAKDNANYSRSFAFAWSIPYYHVGVRASYPVCNTLTAMLCVCNGWNGSEANNGKTFGTQLAFAPASNVSLIANWIGGPEEPDSVSKCFRNVLNACVNVQLSEAAAVGLDATYGTEQLGGAANIWKGAACYARYALSAQHALAVRGELYSDPEGFTTLTAQNLGEVTLTYEYKPLASLLVRSELRHDWSNENVFDGDTGPAVRKNQTTLLFAAIVMF